jgi:putative DNA primase/helicase
VTTADIAARLALRRFGREWRGACPACGYREALILSERGGRPLWHCVACADKEGLTRAIKDAVGGLPASPRPERLPRGGSDPAARVARAEAIWRGAEPITADCPAGLYLARRGIAAVAGSPALRWRRDVPHPSGGRRLALLARIDDANSGFAGVQRVFLTSEGAKADIEPAKASLGVVAGGAARLASPVDGQLAIAEGIESAAAAGLLLGLPAWSAISAGNMAKSMDLPRDVQSLVIAVDRDPAGEHAAREAAARWRREGRTVRFLVPTRAGADANDLVREARQ